MTKVPDFTPEKWDKWVKDKKFAEDRVEHLEDELDKALDEQDRMSRDVEDLRSERDAEKRLRVQAENDARRAKAAADQAAAAAAAASRSLKMGEKQLGGSKDGEAQELRVEIQQLKATNHGLDTQIDALAADHERLAALVASTEKDKASVDAEAAELRGIVATLEREKGVLTSESQARTAEWDAVVASADAAKAEAAALDAQNQRLGDELDRLAGTGKKKGGGADPAELATAVKARKEAEERAAFVEEQVVALQAELRTAREEVEALQDEAELKAGAAREGIAIADAQTATVTEELNVLRVEVTTLREQTRIASEEGEQAASVEREKLDSLRESCAAKEDELVSLRQELATHWKELEALRESAAASERNMATLRQRISEADALCKEAQEKASASDAHAAELATALTVAQQAATKSLEAEDEEGTAGQLMEVMALLKGAEAAKQTAQEEASAGEEKIAELEGLLATAGQNDDGSDHRQRAAQDEAGTRAVANGDASEDSAGRIANLEDELEHLRETLKDVSSERDAALDELRRADQDSVSGHGAPQEETAREEMENLRRECEQLRAQVGLSEAEDSADDVAGIGAKRVKSLEDQVERLAHEHTRQNDSFRGVSARMEKEKEELSQELIAAKLQVAQLFMEVDGLKLRYRQEAIATTAATILEMGESAGPSPSSSAHTSPPPSPASTHTLDL